MSVQLNELIKEIVQKVHERLLTQDLRLPAIICLTNKSEIFQRPATSFELARLVDHTLLKAEATESDIKKLCEEARKYNFATVCVNSAFIAKAAEFLSGTEVKPITVVGFPLGSTITSAKAFEAREAIKNGAREIDMVINIGELKSINYAAVLEDIRAVVEASKPYPVKVILETALLDLNQKIAACILSKAAGAAYVKTSTGFGPGGATVEDIALMRQVVGPEVGVKASGGIRTLGDALAMIDAGASRLGASASVTIVEAALHGIPAPTNSNLHSTSKSKGKSKGY